MSDAMDFPECEQFKDVLHRYQNCRHERLTPEKCDKWRVAMGLEPVKTKQQKPLTIVQRAVSAAKAAAQVAVNGFHPLTQEQMQARLAICQTCEFFNKNRCKLCGCGLSDRVSLSNKLAHPDQQCPHVPPKWGKVQGQSQ